MTELDGSATVAAFPLGGIGTGNVSIGARGEFRDWELENHPDTGHANPFSFFSVSAQAVGGERITRVLESRLQAPHQGDQGYPVSAVGGLPRLARSRMIGEYPLLRVEFDDDVLPVDIALEAFTPLVPLDADESGIPAAVLRYRVTNPGSTPVDVSIVGSLGNPIGAFAYRQDVRTDFDGHPFIERRDDGRLRGLHFGSDLAPDHLRTGTLSLVTADENVTTKRQWLVGFWNDGARSFWNDLRDDGRLEDETVFSLDTDLPPLLAAMEGQDAAAHLEDHLTRLRVGSLGIVHEVAPGETRDFEFILSWSFPNRPTGWLGHIIKRDPNAALVTRNHYATRFPDSWAAASYLRSHQERLEGATRAFHHSLFDSTLDPAVVDALSANLTVVRSTTCFRLEDGTFAAWEGSFDHAGSCEGTCTHVWSYAQSVAHLFPELERSARRVEFLLETDSDGAMQFRTNRIFGGPGWGMIPAVDGQLGTVIRLYREWRFSGDDAFLRELWPLARRAIDYASTAWDLDHDGVLDARMHNTYDIEFAGPEPLANVYFLAALRAGARMASHLGDDELAARYDAQADCGAAAVDAQLFNGEYYEQQLDDVDEFRYQYGTGVLSDQLLGQLQAHIVGLGHVLPEEHVKTAIKSIFGYNFRRELTTHESTQRTFALNDEGGLLLASWPRGGRPALPFVYADEVWTGVEYQVAAHLIFEGFAQEGLTIARATRARHDGVHRNPWNEAECGNHYARSLASWALLLALSGCRWDGSTMALAFDPAEPGEFRSFFSTGQASGSVAIDVEGIVFRVDEGRLAPASLHVRGLAVPLPDGFAVEAGSSIRLSLP